MGLNIPDSNNQFLREYEIYFMHFAIGSEVREPCIH